jgi:predicted ArsR family transcriptional regulator
MRQATIHPTRVAILNALADGPLSPKQVSDKIGTSLGATAYHFRKLAQDGTIKLYDERRVRGAVEHIYKVDGRRMRSTPENLAAVAIDVADRLDQLAAQGVIGADDKARAKRLRRAAGGDGRKNQSN